MCDCPHRHVLSAQLAPAIKQMRLKRVNCHKCCDPDALIICLGCLKNFCTDHVHKCCPLVYFPAENILFCKECRCEVLSLDLASQEQEQCFDVLRTKFKSLRNYNLRMFSGANELMPSMEECDKEEEVFIEETTNFIPYGESADQVREREEKKQRLADLHAQILEIQGEKETLVDRLAQLQEEGHHKSIEQSLPPKPTAASPAEFPPRESPLHEAFPNATQPENLETMESIVPEELGTMPPEEPPADPPMELLEDPLIKPTNDFPPPDPLADDVPNMPDVPLDDFPSAEDLEDVPSAE